MIEEILPAEVAAVETTADLLEGALFPEEEAAIERAVAKRRNEFVTVRLCARQAMARLGLPPAPLVPGERREPRWPAGVVGSLTHCAGYRAAAVGLASQVVTIGIDAEPNEPLPEGVLDNVSLPGERTMLAGLSRTASGTHWDRLLFSAKESVYKAWFPLAGRWLGFDEARITIDVPTATFRADLLVPGPSVAGSELTVFAGRWQARDGLLRTAVTTLHDAAAS